jgi:hypothetical protein
MSRPRAPLIAALVAVSAIAAATSANAGPEHERLTAMCGTWDVEMTFWFQPGRPGVTTRGTSTIQSLLNGLFVEEKIEGTLNGAPFTTLAWTGFNTSTHRYEATRIASTNTIRIAETGGYDEAARQFELKADYAVGGDVWHQRRLSSRRSPTDAAASYLSFGGCRNGRPRSDTRRAKEPWAGP